MLNRCWYFMKRLDYFSPLCELVKLSKQSRWALCSTSAFSLKVTAIPIYFSYAVYILHCIHFSIIYPGTVFIKGILRRNVSFARAKVWLSFDLMSEFWCLKFSLHVNEITELQRGNHISKHVDTNRSVLKTLQPIWFLCCYCSLHLVILGILRWILGVKSWTWVQLLSEFILLREKQRWWLRPCRRALHLYLP